MQQADTRIHGTVHERPLTRFGVERQLLAALPDVPAVLSVWKEVAVHRDGHVVYKHALYSAPFTLVGKLLWLKATDTVIQLFHRQELVATPPGQRAGSRHTVRDHQLPKAQAWLEHDPQWCLARAKDIGPSCHGLILALFNDKVLVNLRGAQGLIRLRQNVGDLRLEAACERARGQQPEVQHHQGHPRLGLGQRTRAASRVGPDCRLPERRPFRPCSPIPADPLTP
ncbi:Mu transposase domain-containing protein [Burkholderia pseudomultivorans]|uniref:Mu transposase domain-containing protein n=1 Tax=Burkholderia pseudomultivorans TaxID=1207504 RepID=UPI000AD50F5B